MNHGVLIWYHEQATLCAIKHVIVQVTAVSYTKSPKKLRMLGSDNVMGGFLFLMS